MKKINYQQVFYKFLVENGLLFEYLELISGNKLNTLKKQCNHTNPKNYIKNAYLYNRIKYNWDLHWKLYNDEWCKLLIQIKQIKPKKNEKRN